MVSQMDNELIIVRTESAREIERESKEKGEQERIEQEKEIEQVRAATWRQIKIFFRADPKSDVAVAGPVP